MEKRAKVHRVTKTAGYESEIFMHHHSAVDLPLRPVQHQADSEQLLLPVLCMRWHWRIKHPGWKTFRNRV